MRYTWDDRVDFPRRLSKPPPSPPWLKQVPSYEVHIAPIVKRYCLSCHRPGKKNNNNYMSTYEEIMTSGDHAPTSSPAI